MLKTTPAVLIAISAAMAPTSAQDRPARSERPAAPAPLAPLAPVAPLAPLAPLPADEGRQSWTLSMGTGWTRLHVEARGRVELTDDERDIKSVSPNGSFEISSKGWLSLFGQQYLVRGNADGTTTRRLSIGGAERPIDAEARAWIADTIRRLVRNGFGAEARVARILAQQGPTGVLDEISRLDGDFTKARYFNWLLKQPRLDRPTAERALKQAGHEIGSSFELARVLVAFAEAVPLDDAIAPTFVEAVNAIGSDFERAHVLMTLVASERPTPAAVKVVLESTPRIGSDFEKARVLGQLAQKRDLGADTLLALIRASASIGSDFERSRVLLQLIAMQPIDMGTRQALLDVTARIGSDYERGRVMSAMLREGALR
jgi:hypothetical protein